MPNQTDPPTEKCDVNNSRKAKEQELHTSEMQRNEEDIANDWKTLATVFSRIAFIVFFIAFLAITTFLYSSLPIYIKN